MISTLGLPICGHVRDTTPRMATSSPRCRGAWSNVSGFGSVVALNDGTTRTVAPNTSGIPRYAARVPVASTESPIVTAVPPVSLKTSHPRVDVCT